MLLPSAPLARAATALLGSTVFLGLAGCSEWDKYWAEDSPTGPGPSHDTVPPVVTLATPTGPDSLHASPASGSAYRIVVNATDDVGVRLVRIHVDAATPHELASPPWESLWDTTTLEEATSHRVWAVAEDSAGNVGTSPVVWAQVFNAGPQVVISAPAESALILGTVRVAADFPGQSPEISQVEFQADVWSVGTVTSAPWEIDLDTSTLPDGVHYLVAKATTTLGHVGVSAPVRTHVNNGTPTMTIEFPPNLHRVATRGTLVLLGVALDGQEGEIPGTRLTWASDLDGALGTGRELRFANLTPGMHVITGTGTNAWGTPGDASRQIEVVGGPSYSYCGDLAIYLFADYFCTFCHDPAASTYPDSELDLRSYAAMMHGGKTTIFESIYPCRPESSLVFNKITQASPWVGERMPPQAVFPAVPAELVEELRTWILEGAPPDDPAECP
jgi:hypothetical protein